MLGELFDPTAELLVHDRLRPHWGQAGAIVFVTARLNDSIPQDVIQRWGREKTDWIQRACKRLKITESLDQPWHALIEQLPEDDQHLFHRHFNRQRETKLDECLGSCILRNPEFAEIVSDSLLHFDGVRYRMGDFVIMPNHIHLLAAFQDAVSMETQFDSWLHYTATKINRKTGVRGHLWQQEPFDHLVRSVEQYEYLRNYIRDNPSKANLSKGDFLYRHHDG